MKIISHDAHMDAFIDRHAELACEVLSLSNYSSRPRPAEVPVDGDRHTVERRRETCEDLVAGEETS
jgi:hypothetical protein